jgi:hypothetical protein
MSSKPPHRIAVRVLIGLGVLFIVLAIFAVWAERQLLDTDEWVNTSSGVLEDQEIQTALGDYLTNELSTQVDVEQAVAQRLPPQAQQLAGPIAGALEQAAGAAANRALQSGRLLTAWEEVNRAAHQQLIDLIEEKGEFQGEGGEVALELKPLVEQIADRVGLPPEVADRIPDDTATLTIIKEDQIESAQKMVSLLKGLAIVFTILGLGSFGLAIYLASDRRQMTVLWCGLVLILAGVAVLALRHLAGGEVVDSLVQNESNIEAGDHAWSIGTSLMRSIAITVLIYGALFVIASWLGSQTKSARRVRELLAPYLRDEPQWFYGALVLAALIYFAFAPTHGLRAVLTLLVLVGLAAFGLAALRRQTAEEFPNA